MKKILFLLFLLISFKCFAQYAPEKMAYDSVLAKKLGADEYGMKTYIMAFLKRGPHPVTDPVAAAKLQTAHLKNIMRLAADDKLIIAGPFLDDQALRGIFIFNVSTIAEAKALTESDPAIQAGDLVMELRPWYASAALVEMMEIHKTIQKKSILER